MMPDASSAAKNELYRKRFLMLNNHYCALFCIHFQTKSQNQPTQNYPVTFLKFRSYLINILTLRRSQSSALLASIQIFKIE